MPRLQIVVPNSDPSYTADGTVTVQLNRAIHTRKVVLKSYSFADTVNMETTDDHFMQIHIPWLSTGFYNKYNGNAGPDQSIKLPIELEIGFGASTSLRQSTLVNNLDWEFHVPGGYIPSTFQMRATNYLGQKLGTGSGAGSNTVFMLYFEFEERIEGI